MPAGAADFVYFSRLAHPKTIHDFGGFPQALFDQQYLAPGFSEAAQKISACMRQSGSGQSLNGLRDRGVLIVGSGNIVHNLRTMQMNAAPNQAYDWAIQIDQTIADYLHAGNLAALPDFQQLGAMAQQSHPTYEHFLPLLYSAGAAEASETPQFFNTSFQGASISMRSVVWGG